MKLIFKFSIILMVLAGCKRDNVDVLGPSYVSAPEGFAVTSFTANASSVNFRKDSILFNAAFSHNVSWKLTITGQQSGAVREVTGVSNSISNMEWKGTHNREAFFKQGETALATLSFFGTKLTSSNPIKIDSTRNFTTYGTFPTWGDFEDSTKTLPSKGWFDRVGSWGGFTGTGTTFGVESKAIDYNGQIVPSVEGEKYYYLKGLGLQPVFVGGVQYNGGSITYLLPKDPDSVWVNIYLYGTGDANAVVELEYLEIDFDGTVKGHTGKDDDAFVAKIALGHRGWKLFSFKYSSLTPSVNADFGGSGNKIHEPNRITLMNLILTKKSNPDSPVEVYFDFPILTVGGPFDPSK